MNDNDINNKFKKIMKRYDEMNDNYIISEINIQKGDINKDIRIINSYEQCKRETNCYNLNIEEYGNENEIKECKIKINNKIIPFNYFYKFKGEGKYEIKYLFKENINKIDFLFYNCCSLANIDFSNLNTQKVTNMSYTFCYCKSLKNINLSNFNTQNVTNMSYMFHGCESLTNIDLSKFDTRNVINMSSIFSNCCSLKTIDLSNFNTQNVTSMVCMF